MGYFTCGDKSGDLDLFVFEGESGILLFEGFEGVLN